MLTTGLAIAWFLIAFLGIQPALTGASAGSLDAFRIPFGGFGGLVKTAILRPWEVIAYMLTTEKVKYVFQLLTPVLFLPLLSWRVLLALPALFYNLISTFWYQSNLQYHYHNMLIPVFSIVALFSLERFHRLGVRRALTVFVLLATMFSLFLWGPVQGSREPSYYPDPKHPECVAADEALTLIPNDAVVSAVDKFAAHLANRERIYVFPNPYSASYWGDDSMKGQRLPGAGDVEYVMVMPALLSEEAAQVYEGLAEEGFLAIYNNQGIVLLRREPASEHVAEY
jgi:uncharacterized membrane protein